MLKVESKYLIFKTNIAGMKTRLLVDNGSKAKLIDEFFVCTNKFSIFKLERCINLMLENGKVIQKLNKKAFINVIIGDYSK